MKTTSDAESVAWADFDSVLELAGVPDGSEIVIVEHDDGGVRIEYNPPE